MLNFLHLIRLSTHCYLCGLFFDSNVFHILVITNFTPEASQSTISIIALLIGIIIYIWEKKVKNTLEL